MEIEFLHVFDKNETYHITELAKLLNLSSIQILELIAKINHLEPNLVVNTDSIYYLTKRFNWLNTDFVNKLLHQEQLDDYNFILMEKIESTNAHLLKNIDSYKDKTILSCNWQYSGRGRFGRKWLSHIGEDLAVSVVYHFNEDFNVGVLPLLCAVAVNRLFKNHNIRSLIKWPNDIYFENAKIAGILVENILRHKQFNVVIGIGLNNIIGQERNKFLVKVVLALDQLLSEFGSFGFPLLRREWLDNCLHLNEEVSIFQEGNIIATGIHSDITETGELIIKTDKDLQKFSSSAISLRLKNQNIDF